MTPVFVDNPAPAIAFEYLYRDGGNYKSFARVVFANPNGLTAAEAEARFVNSPIARRLFEDVCDFRPANVGLAAPDEVESDDLGEVWCEVELFEAVTEAPTDVRTLDEFLNQLTAGNAAGQRLLRPTFD